MKKAGALWLGLFIFLGLFFQNCGRSRFDVEIKTSSLSSLPKSYFIQETPRCIFNGQEMTDGESVQAFLNSTPEFTNGCMSETRTCQNGVLSGTYTYARCEAGPKSCLFNGITLQSGESIQAFSAAENSQCVSESRTCLDGRLSGNFPSTSCSQNICLFMGRNLNAGQSFTYYRSNTGNCQAQTGFCQIGGQLVDSQKSPITGAIYESCSTGTATCQFQGQTLSANQTFLYYPISNDCQALGGFCDSSGSLRDSVSQAVLTSGFYNSANLCQSAANNGTSTPNGTTQTNPSTSPVATTIPADTGTTATPLYQDCTWNGQVIRLGEEFQYYLYPVVYYRSQSCTPFRGICINGELRNSSNFGLLPGNLIYSSCTVSENYNDGN